MAETSNQAEIVIKRVKKGGGHEGAHGAWKVAYADFVTAMMAFFLLLWLLNATTEEQRVGISNYFAPGAVSREASGAGGLLGGLSPNEKGSMSSTSPVHVTLPLPPIPAQVSAPGDQSEDADKAKGQDPNADQTGEGDSSGTAKQGNEKLGSAKDGNDKQGTAKEGNDKQLSEKQKQQIAKQAQEKEFKRAEQELRQAIQAVPELRALKDSLIIDHTPDGLRIQIVDQDKLEMFPLGSAQMFDYTRKLMAKVAEAIKLTKNQISIAGYTDAHPYTRGGNYTNWELSVDRANASRRALIEAGLSPDRIARVTGKADTEPLFPKDPFNPRNRRISITLLQNTSVKS
jgi:chemotaxis protein MotB